MQKTSTTSVPSRSTSVGGTSTDNEWHVRAARWQDANPVDKKSTWYRPDNKPPERSIRCFNCGDFGHHYSTGCSKAHVPARSILVAALTSLGGNASMGGHAGSDPRMTGSDETASEGRITEIEVPGKE